VIAGMMVFISLKELIPTAHKFDKRGILVAVFLVVGMVVMAASLLLFLY
jgi:zinc transporter ZupT